MKKLAIILIGIVVLVCGFGMFALRGFKQAQDALVKKDANTVKVERGDLSVKVVETGTIDAVKSVEVKSRVSGRLARLLVDEGDLVQKGQLIAVIDPKETSLRVQQDQAQLRGAQSAVARTSVELSQRRITAKTSHERARRRLAQLREEFKSQPTLTDSAIEAAQTAYNSAQQARDQLVHTAQPNDRTLAQSNVVEAEAGLKTAESEVERRKGLVDKGYSSQRELEGAQLQVQTSRARYQTAKDRFQRLEEQQRIERQQAEERIRQTRADLERAKAGKVADNTKAQEVEIARLQLREAEAALKDVQSLEMTRKQGQAQADQIRSGLAESMRQLGETEVRAPISGVVSKRFIQEGELVAALSGFNAGTPIVRLEDRSTLKVNLEVNEIDVAKLSIGMNARIDIDALPNQPFDGKIKKISPTSTGLAAQGSQTRGSSGDQVVKYQVEIWLDTADEKVRSGMSAKCSLNVVEKKKVLILPVEYVGKEGVERFVEVLPSSGKKGAKALPEKRTIKVGLDTGSRVEILSGLEEGTVVQKPAFTGPKRQGFMSAETGDE